MSRCAEGGSDATEGGHSRPGMNVALVSSAPGRSSTRRPVSPGIGALCPSAPASFSRLSSQQTQGPSVLESWRGCQGPVEGDGLEKSLDETSVLAEAKPQGPSG